MSDVQADLIDRDQMVFTCSLMTDYAESFLQSLSDERLLEIYDRLMMNQ